MENDFLKSNDIITFGVSFTLNDRFLSLTDVIDKHVLAMNFFTLKMSTFIVVYDS